MSISKCFSINIRDLIFFEKETMNKVSVKTKKKDDFNHKKYLFSAISLIVGLGLSYAVIFHLCDGNVLHRQIADLSKIINLMDVIWYFCLAILAILSFVFSF